MKKTYAILATVGLAILFAYGPVLAKKDMSGGSMGMKMEKPAGMKMGSMDAVTMKAKLGPGKKKEFRSKNKHFVLRANMVPKTPGLAEFTILLTTNDGKPLDQSAKVDGNVKMPGMPQHLPPLTVQRVSDSEWKLSVPLPDAGMWKIYLDVEDQGVQDVVIVKFVTKKM